MRSNASSMSAAHPTMDPDTIGRLHHSTSAISHQACHAFGRVTSGLEEWPGGKPVEVIGVDLPPAARVR